MLYSRWRPDTGGYDYFETAERFGLADDLPVPSGSGGSEIGLPLTEAGRTPRGEMRPAGSGPFAKGMILPLSRSGLGDTSISVSFSGFVMLAAGAVLGYWFANRKRGR